MLLIKIEWIIKSTTFTYLYIVESININTFVAIKNVCNLTALNSLEHPFHEDRFTQ